MLGGVSTIRAFGQQNVFIVENQRRIDRNQMCYLPAISVNRWLAVRLGSFSFIYKDAGLIIYRGIGSFVNTTLSTVGMYSSCHQGSQCWLSWSRALLRTEYYEFSGTLHFSFVLVNVYAYRLNTVLELVCEVCK
jgi:ATP-binding cassette, subfamily C (CFTR/MRP), member 1